MKMFIWIMTTYRFLSTYLCLMLLKKGLHHLVFGMSKEKKNCPITIKIKRGFPLINVWTWKISVTERQTLKENKCYQTFLGNSTLAWGLDAEKDNITIWHCWESITYHLYRPCSNWIYFIGDPEKANWNNLDTNRRSIPLKCYYFKNFFFS